MSQRNVLIVDDEPSILRAMVRALRRLPITVYLAESAADAQVVLGTVRIDLIVTDLRMPEVDGASLLLDVMPRYPNLRAILHSGSLESPRALGLNAFHLSKPCASDLLQDTVMHFLSDLN